ncbi:hypothetical protein BVRB_4g096200 [Beta vulgaris subsp. vulgaris]|uniref:Uncharacterized protein n=1 Tax=Beta vulgaris subsp. vulgaris TaxID=3555 RepID=A0A0J8BDN4_BETVV|nr:hypothetical protein BVRB_4g096200 [Beta vulgaris subsp. vulgaris]
MNLITTIQYYKSNPKASMFFINNITAINNPVYKFENC